MAAVIGGFVRWLLWILLLFGAAVLVLWAVDRVPGAVRDGRAEAERLNATATEFKEREGKFEASLKAQAEQADAGIRRVGRMPATRLAAEERGLVARRAAVAETVLSRREQLVAGMRGDTGAIVGSYQAEWVTLPLIDRVLGLVRARRNNLAVAGLKARIAKYQREVDSYYQDLARRDDLRRRAAAQRRNPLCQSVVVPRICGLVAEERRLTAALRDRKRDIERDGRALSAAKTVMGGATMMSEAVEDNAAIVAGAVAAYRDGAGALAEEAQSRAANRARDLLDRHGWNAFWIVVGILASPLIAKAVSFYLIAPLARRAGPIRLEETATTPIRVGPSSVSVSVPINGTTEIFLRSGAQSSSDRAEGRGRLVLHRGAVLTSLAAGLSDMERLRSQGPDSVTVTAADDEHHEVALVDVPAGGAVAIRPRAIVAVAKARSDRPAIERRWRLGHAISWITFQFRWLIVRGPCTLIVQGRRGVRAEAAGGGRMIPQRLTLGFDAGLAHGAARTATFWFYLRGKQGLFHDSFEGAGSVLFEEREAGGGAGGGRRGGLAGMVDVVRDAVGV